MRTYWQTLIPALLSLSTTANAQRDLSGSLQHSRYKYVYRIDDKEASKLYRKGMEGPIEPFLHTLIDSVPIQEKEEKHLPPGNYVWVRAEKNKFYAELYTEGALRYNLLNDGRGLALALRTMDGSLVADARVRIGSRNIPYDDATHSYRLPRRHKGGYVHVEHKGVISYFTIDEGKGGYYYYRHGSLWDKVFEWAFLHRSRHDPYAFERKFASFLVFSKPKYKPGDTVKGKAFIQDRKGHPVFRPLLLRIGSSYGNADTALGIVRPYRPGGFEFSFLLSDSLKLDLDKQYQVSLEDPGKDIHTAEDQTIRRRWRLAKGSFRYEEYELSAIRLLARADRQENSPGNPVALYVRGADENDMTLPDARVNIYVLPNGESIGWKARHVFLPDTLWKRTQALDPVGETKIIIPDSIFPAASFSYTIHCEMLNSSNELRTSSLSQHYSPDTTRFCWRIQTDSLHIDRLVFNRSTPVQALLHAFDSDDDTLGVYHLSLPGGVRINPYCARYEVSTLPDEEWDQFEPGRDKDESGEQQESDLLCFADRTRDSIHVNVTNPRNIPFWYTIYCGDKIIQKGYGDSLFYQAPTLSKKHYFISLKYMWAGQLVSNDYTVPYREKLLRLEIQKPAFAYPGQETTITIGVKDADGKPVANADVTAYAFTRKFGKVRPPQLPYLGKAYPGRKEKVNFRPGKEDPETVFSSLLDWQRWHGKMGLDTSEYYKFLYPSPIYINREPSPDGMTQVAPFVRTKQGTYPANLLYIDEVPVFFNQANDQRRYSFQAHPGIHSLRIRIAGRQVRLDSLLLEKGMKTFVSINADEPGGHIRVEPMPDSLTRWEQAQWKDYMIRMEDSFDGSFITLSQNGRSFLPDRNSKDPGIHRPQNTSFLAGPFLQQPATLHVHGEYDQDFQPEGNYRFHIEKGLIKEKEVPYRQLFSPHLSKEDAIELHDHALTQQEIDSLWSDYQDRRSSSQDLLDNSLPSGESNGRLEIAVLNDKQYPVSPTYIRKMFLFRCDNPSVMGIYKGSTRHWGNLEQGYYRLLLLLKGDEYLERDSLLIQPSGWNYYLLDHLPVHKKDSFSIRISNTVKKLELPQTIVSGSNELEEVLKSVNDRWTVAGLYEFVSGAVTDINGAPLQGVTVMIKGLRSGTVTDVRGRFWLAVPKKGTLVIAYVGYTGQELPITPEKEYTIRLRPSLNKLEEVVVIGYGTVKRSYMTGSVSYVHASMLEGRVAGLSVRIRGINSMSSQAPLLLIDGVPSSQQLDQLDTARIGSLKYLKGDEATRIYGASAAGGVILITSRQASMEGSSDYYPAAVPLRHDFRDEAFWQPRLTTDEQGLASFKTRLPDDITSWNIHVVGMTSHKQSGFTEDSIRAFKALSAHLAPPNFVIAGDSLEVIGKIMNYLPDSVSVERSFRVDDRPVAKDIFSLRNAHIDRFFLKVGEKPVDSVTLEYGLLKKDDYADGERRTIPVYPVGVKETMGSFLPLDNADTSLTLSFAPDKGPVTVYAASSLLPVLLDEIEHVRHYEYLCNEQLASKLLVLLEQRKIDSLLKRNFTGNKDIYEIIGRLLKTRRPDGLWGWWKDDEPRPWISLHVTEAMLTAENAGYAKMPDKQRLIDHLVYTLQANQPSDRITRIRILQAMNAKVDYRSLIDTAEKELNRAAQKTNVPVSLFQQLELMTLRQTAGLPIDVTAILPHQKHTALGNRYWGEEDRHLFDNAFLNTIQVYRLLKRVGGYDELLRKMRGYFLEKRKNGHWENTYVSSLVLGTILPDVLGEDPAHHPAQLTLGEHVPITSFPYKGEWPSNTPMKVHKTGSLPVYLTAWQQYWNKDPGAVNGIFEVKTHFEKDGKTLELLRAGEPVSLTAEVRVRADADYVMIEIPIPAGCSYEGKMQGYGSEIHREYFKNKVSIFCASLKPGNYTYTIRLMPRWTGVGHLNPAKVEMMYFPVLYGREALKEVRIGGEGLQIH